MVSSPRHDDFTQHRGRLFGVAYRMLGTAAEAEDVVQNAWVRWQRVDRGTVDDPEAFLVTVATRLALNEISSARARREVYVGSWLPEPVLTDQDPALGAERVEAVDMAVMLLMERLSPAERAVYVLREAFDYPFADIAAIIEVSEANARQLAKRAREHVHRERHQAVDNAQHAEILDAFFDAAQLGDLDRLEKLLAADAVAYADGGGQRRAAINPIRGAVRVARYMAGVLAKPGVVSSLPVVTNGGHALMLYRSGERFMLCGADVTPQGVATLYMVVNPEKLNAFPARAPNNQSSSDSSAVPIRSRLPSGSRSSISLPHGLSHGVTPNFVARTVMSRKYRYTKVSGVASPECSDRNSRTSPRAKATNSGSCGSKRCRHSTVKPSWAYQSADTSASATRKNGTTCSSIETAFHSRFSPSALRPSNRA